LREATIWRAVFWTLVFTAVIALAARLDPGFMLYFPGAKGVIPMSTGARVEVVAARGSALKRNADTELYSLQDDGSLKLTATLQEPFQCVTAYKGQLLITFRSSDNAAAGGPSSIYRDGAWVKSVSAPMDALIYDVAVMKDTVYALCLAAAGKEARVLALGDDGWRQAGDSFPFKPDEMYIRGWQGAGDSLELLYAESPDAASPIRDASKTRWYRVSFDGSKWGTPAILDVPQDYVPAVAEAKGVIVYPLVPLKKGDPVRVAELQDGKLVTLVEVPTHEKYRVTMVYLAGVGGQQHVFLAGPGHLWDVPLVNATPAPARELLSVGRGSVIRSQIYVALWFLSAVAMVSLGTTWLIMRLRGLGRKERS